MFMSVFHNWLLEIACENYFVYIKRLSANDTGATGGHQVGLYMALLQIVGGDKLIIPFC